jgi:hypothetical protein
VKQKTTFIITLLFLSSAAFTQTYKTLSKGSYSVKYPADWTVDASTNNQQFTVNAGSDGDTDVFTENVNMVSNNINGYTPQSYAAYSKTYLPKKIKNFTVLEEKAVKQGGKDGYYMVFKGVQEGKKMKWKQMYFIHSGKVYIVTFTAEEKAYANYIKTVAPVLSSFVVK